MKLLNALAVFSLMLGMVQGPTVSPNEAKLPIYCKDTAGKSNSRGNDGAALIQMAELFQETRTYATDPRDPNRKKHFFLQCWTSQSQVKHLEAFDILV
jgi:hypothetical protein